MLSMRAQGTGRVTMEFGLATWTTRFGRFAVVAGFATMLAACSMFGPSKMPSGLPGSFVSSVCEPARSYHPTVSQRIVVAFSLIRR